MRAVGAILILGIAALIFSLIALIGKIHDQRTLSVYGFIVAPALAFPLAINALVFLFVRRTRPFALIALALLAIVATVYMIALNH